MNNIRNATIAVAFSMLLTSPGPLCADTTILSKEDLSAIDQQAAKIVASMTLDEKLNFIHGDKEIIKYDGPPAIPRLNIPSYIIAHGPYGPRVTIKDKETGKKSIIAGTFPSCSINYAASWDPDLVERVAQGFGKEVRCAGDHSVAGPAINIIRDLRCGRSGEYYTEDPYLNARTAVPFVLGMQSEHVIVTL
jgi:beta-glucosidase